MPPWYINSQEACAKRIVQLIKVLEARKTEIEAKLREYDDSCVVAEKMLYNGVSVHFGVVYKDIVDDHEACRLTIEGGKIMMSRHVKE